MAFCKQCGTDLRGARFCPKCGTSADGEMMVQQRREVAYSATNIRRESLEEMDRMLTYFGKKKAEYVQYEALDDEIRRRQTQGYYGWLIAGVIMALVAFFLLKISGNLDQIDGYIIFGIPVVVVFSIFALLRKNNEKRIRIAQRKFAKVSTELTDYHAAYGYCPLGVQYTNPIILNVLNSLIHEGQASTPEEALKCFIKDIRDQEKTELMKKQIQETQEMKKEIKRVGKSAKKAADYASASFWFKD